MGVTVTGDISDIMAELDNLIGQLGEITDKIVDLIINVDDSQLVNVDASTDEVTESLNEASDAALGLGESIGEIDTTQLDEAKESADGLSESLGGAGSGAESTSSSGGAGVDVSGDADLMEGLGGVAAAVGGASILDELANAAGNYEDSWARVASVMGTSAASVKSEWGGAVDQMATNTGRRAGAIREYITQMGIAGVRSQSVLTSMFTGVSGAAFATGTSVESITNALRRVVSTGTLGARQLMSLGLSEQDVMSATGMTLDQVNEKMATMDSTSRAAFMAQIINAKYAGEANENYKNSWQHVTDQLGAAWDYFMRVFGQMVLPIVIPAMEVMTAMLKGLAEWFGGLNDGQKQLIGTIVVLGLGFLVLVGFIAMVTTAVSLMNLAFLANPLFWVVIGVMALVAAFLYLYNTNEQFRASMDGVWNAMTGFGNWLQGGFNAIINAVGGAWTNFITTLQNGVQWIIDLPGNMFKWASEAMTRFVDGIKQGVAPITEALGGIQKLFPQSPPREGPLSEITPDKMTTWMGGVVGAGLNTISNFNLGSVGMPNIPRVGTTNNSSATTITVNLAGANIASNLDATTVGEKVGSGLASKLAGQASNAGVNVVNVQR
jgi:hypothetical protein